MNYNPTKMETVAADLPTKSAKIRALASAGYKRNDIARFLGTRYQFVRNVLVEENRRKSTQASNPDELETTRNNAGRSSAATVAKVKLGAGGAIAVPVHLLASVGAREGDVLIASVEDGEIRLRTFSSAIRHAQEIVRRFVPEGVSLVDELLEDRRREVENDRHH
jgi:bifunctional DNA-binding transcriptional regulator/antitoxin component of YhaV-PrlF toxin-antitoxin module